MPLTFMLVQASGTGQLPAAWRGQIDTLRYQM